MKYDCTKPLGDNLEDYFDADLKLICNELVLQGIVYESQFEKLWSMVCKQNATELASLFRKKTRRGISYGYDSVTCHFFFYDLDVYKKDEAMRLSVQYQSNRNI